jgi:Protein of unknown function (DUF2971)
MSKRIYKFMSAQYGLSNLEKRRLKVSTIDDDLNDPFDLASIDLTDPIIENAIAALIPGWRGKNGLLCFSRNWDNLLLWSHYGASHTGLCLGFDIPDGPPGDAYDIDVHYQPNLLQINGPDDVNFDLVTRLLRTKHESWSYEQEVRLFIGINDPPDANGLWWYDFGPKLELKEVIAGVQCVPRDLQALADILKGYGNTVKCSWAYMRKDAFLLVRHDFSPPWHSPSS